MAEGKKKPENIHKNHRKRMREEFLKSGLDNMPPHKVLEMLLFYSIPQGDTNPLAHRLIQYFGSLSGVFDAAYEDLLQVEGIGPASAMLIKVVAASYRAYSIDRVDRGLLLNSTENLGTFLMPYFAGKTREEVYLLCLDSKLKAVCCQKVGEGSVDTVLLNTREIISVAVRHHATSLVLAHNHPRGVALPSSKDVAATRKLKEALKLVNVRLLDHIIVADNDFVSMLDSGYLADFP